MECRAKVERTGTGQVILTVNGRPVNMPWQVARRLARMLHETSLFEENRERLNDDQERERLFEDQRLVWGAGVPINLGVPAKAIREVMQEMPSAGRGPVFGKPTLIVKEPTNERSTDADH